MKILYKISILLSSAVLFATGCIKETQPTDIATKEQVGASSAALEAMVSSIPAQMVQGYLIYGGQTYEYDMAYPGVIMMLDSAAGEIVSQGETGYDWYGNWSLGIGLAETSGPSYVPWRTFYMFIKGANDVIGAIDPETATDQQIVFLGKALAVRAFCYLQLAQIYEFKPATDPNVKDTYKPENDITGLTVPIVSEKTGEAEGKNNPRVAKDAMYKFILDDLTAAAGYLDGTSCKATVLPSLAVVYGITAKAYLAQCLYAEAAEYADKAITAFGGSPLTQAQWEDPINGFNNAGANANSWMWYLAYSAETMGNLCNFVGHMSPEATWSAYSWSAARGINKELYNKIPDTDFRKHSWLDPDKTAYYDYKLNRDVFDGAKALPSYTNIKFRPAQGDYATYSVGGASNVPLMRVEEMYFIKAEGLAMSGNLAGGKDVLTTLIKTRNPEYTCEAPNASAFQDELMIQKRVEFWGEGIVFFDFKRLGYGIHNGYPGTNVQKGFRFTVNGVAPWWNWTIPQFELNGNPALQGLNNPDPSATVEEWQE